MARINCRTHYSLRANIVPSASPIFLLGNRVGETIPDIREANHTKGILGEDRLLCRICQTACVWSLFLPPASANLRHSVYWVRSRGKFIIRQIKEQGFRMETDKDHIEASSFSPIKRKRDFILKSSHQRVSSGHGQNGNDIHG